MKVCACTCVLNDADYIWWALRSVHEVVDYHVVVEGAAFNGAAEATSEGLSTDGTQDEIERFIAEFDPQRRKVIYDRVGFCEWMTDLRNCYLFRVPTDTDYVLIVDADHIHDPNEIRRIRQVLEAHPNILAVRAELVFFYRTMHHVLRINPELERGWDSHHLFHRYSTRLRYRGELPRVYQRWYSKQQMYDPKWPPFEKDAEGQAPWKSADEITGTEPWVVLVEPHFRFWHFGWTRMRERMDMHLLHRFRENIKICQVTNTWEPGSPYKQMSTMSDEEILEWLHTYHKIWTNVYDSKCGERVEEYHGPYPENVDLEKHPFWGKDLEFFGLEAGIDIGGTTALD